MMTRISTGSEITITIDDFYQLKFPLLSIPKAIQEVKYLNFLQNLGISDISSESTEEYARNFMITRDIIREFDLEKVFATLYRMMKSSYPHIGAENNLEKYIIKLERLKVVFMARKNQVTGLGPTGRHHIHGERFDGNPIVNRATRTMIDILIKLSDPTSYKLTKETLDQFFDNHTYDTYVAETEIDMSNLRGARSVAIEGCAQGLNQRMRQLSEGLKPESESEINNRLRWLFDQKITRLQTYIGTDMGRSEGIGHASSIKEHLEKYMQPSQNLSRNILPNHLTRYNKVIDSTFKISDFITYVEEFYKEKFTEVKERALFSTGVEESKDSEPDSPKIEWTKIELTEYDYLTLLHPLFFDESVIGEVLINFTDVLFLDSLFKIGSYYVSDDKDSAAQYILDEALFF